MAGRALPYIEKSSSRTVFGHSLFLLGKEQCTITSATYPVAGSCEVIDYRVVVIEWGQAGGSKYKVPVGYAPKLAELVWLPIPTIFNTAHKSIMQLPTCRTSPLLLFLLPPDCKVPGFQPCQPCGVDTYSVHVKQDTNLQLIVSYIIGVLYTKARL